MAIFNPSTKLYKQEGKTGMYQSMLWALAEPGFRRIVPVSWGEYSVFFRKNFIAVYWDENAFEHVTDAVLERAPSGLPDEWRAAWERIDAQLTEYARELVTLDLSHLSLEKLRARYENAFMLDQKMWSQSIFIDAFDPGFDQTRMHTIASEIGLSEEEVQILVTPKVPSYLTQWARALEELRSGAIDRQELSRRFFWYATDYWQFSELSDEFIDAELAKHHEEVFVSPEEEQRAILERYGLLENPLATFEELTTWRDIRKRLNYTGLYALMKILRETLGRSGITPELASAVLPHQAPDLFSGNLSEDQLRSQFEDGVLFHMDASEEGHFLFGSDAVAAWEEIDVLARGEEQTELRGMTASRGKATGRVRIVPHIANQNAALMQPGDILVTSMTRPEFVPLMRIAGAIVTNEGGITSHAAIVSRELGKPCIIGTKTATTLLREGESIEVDADAGVIRRVSMA